jgi:hypothetical protein
VARKIHTLVQDAHYHHLIRYQAIEQDMGACGISPVARKQVITRSPSRRIATDDFDGPMQANDIAISLILTPSFKSEMPNLSQIASSARRKRMACHFE